MHGVGLLEGMGDVQQLHVATVPSDELEPDG
jgi:hypothetical protein